MRVLHVIPSAAPRDGGPNVAVRALARGLATRGVDVTVATTNADGERSLDVPVHVPVVEDGVEYRYFARSAPGAWKLSWPLTRWLAGSIGEFDVVHVHALFSYATIAGCRTAARARVPYVLRPLGTLSGWSLRHRAWKKRPYYALIERSHLQGAAAVHVTSQAEADDVARLGFGDRSHVIPLGVDVDRAVRSAPHVAETGSVRPLRLLFLSRLHEKKNVPVLLRALATLSGRGDIELTIAGDGDPRYRDDLRRLSIALGLGTVVRFLGHVAGEVKWQAFAEADCFVLPSVHENFGLAVAEALAAGLPVIVTPGVALAPSIAVAGAGVVAEPTELGLAHAIAWAAAHRDALREMGEEARRFARAELSWDASCSKLIELYGALLTVRSAGRPELASALAAPDRI